MPNHKFGQKLIIRIVIWSIFIAMQIEIRPIRYWLFICKWWGSGSFGIKFKLVTIFTIGKKRNAAMSVYIGGTIKG